MRNHIWQGILFIFVLSLIMKGCLPNSTNDKENAYDCDTKTTISGNTVMSASSSTWQLKTGHSEKMCPVKATIEYGWANSYRDDDTDRPEHISALLRANLLIIADPVIDEQRYRKDNKNYWKMSFEKSAKEIGDKNPIIYSIIVGYKPLNEPYDEVWVNAKMEYSIYTD